MGQCGRAKGVGQMVESERFDLDPTGSRQTGVRRREGKPVEPVAWQSGFRCCCVAFVVAAHARHESVAAYAAAAAATRLHW